MEAEFGRANCYYVDSLKKTLDKYDQNEKAIRKAIEEAEKSAAEASRALPPQTQTLTEAQVRAMEQRNEQLRNEVLALRQRQKENIRQELEAQVAQMKEECARRVKELQEQEQKGALERQQNIQKVKDLCEVLQYLNQ